MNKPTLFKRPNSRWWWFSYRGERGRRQESCKQFGLSVDKHTRVQALQILLEKFGIIPGAPEPGTETLSWFRDEIKMRIEPVICLRNRFRFEEYDAVPVRHSGIYRSLRTRYGSPKFRRYSAWMLDKCTAGRRSRYYARCD